MSSSLAHDKEAEILEVRSQVVGSTGEVHHNGAVAVLAKADQLIVLADDLRGAFGKVECERGLICPKVVNVEDELFGEIFRGTPNDPANARVDLGSR